MKRSRFADQQINALPLHDRVIIKPASAEQKSAGGIIIPHEAQEKPQRGLVMAIGPGNKNEPTIVKVGDIVLYGRYSGTDIRVTDMDLLIMRESDILLILD